MLIPFEWVSAKLFGDHHIKSGPSILNSANILWILLVSFFILLSLIPLSPSVYATSWYASVGTWEIHRNSQTMNFTLDDYCSGNITGIEATPRGMMVGGIHSRYVNIDLDSVGVKQRRSAFTGEIKSEEYTNITASAEEPINREIVKRFGSPYYELNFTEVWPVHFQSEKALIYNGRMINDLEQSKNNLDWVATSFRYSPELNSIRSCRMDLERLNISLIADNEDVMQVDFLPTKSLNYSIQSFSSGQTTLSYAQTGRDMTAIISKGEETFIGNYSLTAAINMSATNKNATRVS